MLSAASCAELSYYWPFFSSCDKTEAANFFTSDAVGCLLPESTFEASVDTFDELCFFGISQSPFKAYWFNVLEALSSNDFRNTTLVNCA